MSHFYTGHFHNGWYDTQFSMPILIRQPCQYYTSPFPPIPCSTWINTPLVQSTPPILNIPQPPATKPSARKAPTRMPALPVKPALRSILKPSRSYESTQKKSVHFTSSSTSPPLAAPGTYKYAGKPQPPRARHPARGHPCLTKSTRQRAQQAMASGQHPPQAPPQKLEPASRSSNSSQKLPANRLSRAPTPPPADFFQRASKVQHPPQQFKIRANHQPAQQQRPVRPAPTRAPSYNIYYCGPYSSDSEDSNTDIGMVKMVKHMKQTETGKVKAAKAEADVATTRKSLQALAKEFDRKNLWRRVAR